MQSIMILGAGVMQQPAYYAARRNGWYSIGVDRDPYGPAVTLADAFEQVDLADPPGVLSVAERYHGDGRLDAVFTAGTDFSSTVAYVGERLGLPGIPYDTALRATDKALMRECFRDAGVPSPRFRTIKEAGSLEDSARRVLEDFELPFVIKPVDNMGARGVQLVQRPRQARAALETAMAFSRTRRAIAEELIPGCEYSVDALVFNGEVMITGVADRHIHFAPYFIEMGHTIPAALGSAELQELIAVFERGVRALGITHGAAKGDVFYGRNGAMVGEIAARLSGGYMSGWTYPLCSGVELTEAAMRIALGQDPRELLNPRFQRVSAERAVISAPGRVRRANKFASLRNRDGVAEVFQRVRTGDHVRFPRNNVEKCGNIIAVGDTRGEAVTSALKAIRSIVIELEPGNGETAAFLFGPQTPAAHHAFGLEDPCNRAALAAMPPLCGILENRGGRQRSDAKAPPSPVSGGNGRARGSTAELKVLALPHLEREHQRDWRGLTPRETIAELRRERSIAFVPGSSGESALGGVFWRAFLIGGLQGARYLIDTIEECEYEAVEREILSRYLPLYV